MPGVPYAANFLFLIGGWGLGAFAIFAVAIAGSAWIYVGHRPDSLELAYLYARALHVDLERPTSPAQRCKGVTELDCWRDAWICADSDYRKVEKKLQRSGEGSIPYMRLLATCKEAGSPNQRVIFTKEEPQTCGHAKQFRVILRTDSKLTNEASGLCTSIGAILDQMMQLLSQPDAESSRQSVCFEDLLRALSLADARALLRALYVGQAWGLIKFGRRLSYVILVTLIFRPYAMAAEKIENSLLICQTENGEEWSKVPGELKNQAAKARQAKTTTYINNKVIKMEKGSGDYFENNQSL